MLNNFGLEILNSQFIIKPFDYENFDKIYHSSNWSNENTLFNILKSITLTIYQIALTIFSLIEVLYSNSLQPAKIPSFTAVRCFEKCIGHIIFSFFHKMGAFIIQDADYHREAYQLQKQLFSNNAEQKEKALDRILLGSNQKDDTTLSRLKNLSSNDFKTYLPFFSAYLLIEIDSSLMKHIDIRTMTQDQQYCLFPNHCDQDKVKERLQTLDEQQLNALWEKISLSEKITFYPLLIDEQKDWIKDPGPPPFSDDEIKKSKEKFDKLFARYWLGKQIDKHKDVQTIQEAAYLLEVGIDASNEEINRQFKKKALACHPDKNQNYLEKANEAFLKLCQAKKLLTKNN